MGPKYSLLRARRVLPSTNNLHHARRAHSSPPPQVSDGLGTPSHGLLRDSAGDSVVGRPFGAPPATPRPAVDVADFVNALWRRRGARGARHWSAGGATGGLRRVSAGGARYFMVESRGARGSAHWSAEGATGGARSLADGGVAGVRAERATGALKARRAERASAQAEHAGTRWSHRRSAEHATAPERSN